MKKKYYFILEGIDGSGKTSLLPLIKNRLDNIFPTLKTKEIYERDEELIKLGINGYNNNIKVLKEQAYMLFWAGRYKQQKEEIINSECDIFLQDRGWSSTFVYSNMTNKIVIDMNFNNDIFIKPDIEFILDLPVKIALERCKNDKEDLFCNLINKEENLTKYRKRFLYDLLYLRSFKNYIIIDSSRNQENVVNDITEYISIYINNNMV